MCSKKFYDQRYGLIESRNGGYAVASYENLSDLDKQFLKDKIALEIREKINSPCITIPFLTLLDKGRWYDPTLYVYTQDFIIDVLTEILKEKGDTRKYMLTPIPETGQHARNGTFRFLCVSFLY